MNNGRKEPEITVSFWESVGALCIILLLFLFASGLVSIAWPDFASSIFFPSYITIATYFAYGVGALFLAGVLYNTGTGSSYNYKKVVEKLDNRKDRKNEKRSKPAKVNTVDQKKQPEKTSPGLKLPPIGPKGRNAIRGQSEDQTNRT